MTGDFPFAGSTIQEVMEKNKKGEVGINEEKWKGVSVEAKDLVMRMTMRDQYMRFSAKACLEHPWLTKASTSSDLPPIIFVSKDKTDLEYSYY